MNPVYQGQAEYLQGVVGIGKGCTVTLFPDHLEVVSKKGEPLLNVPLQAIEAASYVKGGLIRLRLNGNQLHSINFFTTKWRMLGLPGLMISGAAKKGSAFGDALRSTGVNVETKTF